MRKTMFRTAAVLAMLAAAGCAGNGKYTSEHKVRSHERVAGMKAANEFEQARQAFLVGDLDKALRAVDRSITIHPGVARSHVLRGRIMLEQSNMELSIQSLMKAEEIEPENVEAQYYLGLVHERYSQPQEALARFRKAAELEPSNAQYALATAETMVDLGMVDEAEKFLTNGSLAFKHNAGIRQTLGHIAMIRGDHARAVELFSEARLLAPDDWVVLEDLVQAQIAAGAYADAEFNLSRLLNVSENKERRDLRQMRARCLTKVDRPLEAREILIQLTGDAAGQKDVESWIELGNVCFVLRDMNRVRQAAARIVALAPNRPEGYMLRSLMQRRNGDLAAALESAERAVERRGTNVEPLLLRGLVLKDLGRETEARASFSMAARENPAAVPQAGSNVAGVPTGKD
jgi:tetratricopeptide (TPR) repeat protein